MMGHEGDMGGVLNLSRLDTELTSAPVSKQQAGLSDCDQTETA